MISRKMQRIMSMIISASMLVNMTCIRYVSAKDLSKVDFEMIDDGPLYSELNLNSVPEKLYSEIGENLQNAKELDESTFSDLFSLSTINNDGSRSLMTFYEPIKYYDTSDKMIKFIDNSIEPVSNDDCIAFINKGNSYKASFPKNIANGVMFSEDGFSINMIPLNMNEGKTPEIYENEIVYSDVWNESADIHYALENSGIKESIILEDKPGDLFFDFSLSVKGAVPENYKGESISFINEESKESVFVIQPTFITDSWGEEFDEEHEHISYNNYYEIEELNDNNYILHMYLDNEFLNAESTVYPCTIDPSIWAVNYSNDSSAYVEQSTGIVYSNNQLCVGNFSGIGERISYVKALGVDKLRWIEPDRLRRAEFKVKSATTGYTSSCKINCYDSTAINNVSSITYSGLISSIGTLQSSTTFTSLGTEYSFNITELFKKWIKYELGEGGKSSNYGFILRGAAGYCTPGRYFSSSSSSDTYFYIEYEEGEEIESGFYMIKNSDSNNYLKYNGSSQISVGIPTESDIDYYKWQIILSKSPDGNTSYGKYTIRPYKNLNVSMKGVTTNQALTTNSNGNDFRIIRNSGNSDSTFRIMPFGTNYASVSNGIKVVSGYASIKEYSNVESMKWTFEPVVNRFFSLYSPEKYSDTLYYHISRRMNCYAYAFGFIEHYSISDDGKQQPGYFASNLVASNSGTTASEILNNIFQNMLQDSYQLGYSIEEYLPPSNNESVEQFGSDTRLIAVIASPINRYHFYMQHNDGTWSHKDGDSELRNTAFCSTNSNPIYLNNNNIRQHIYDRYETGEYKFFKITKDAVNDYPHCQSNTEFQKRFYLTDIAGDNIFTSSYINLGEHEASIDTNTDTDFYVFNVPTTRNYTIQTTSCRVTREFSGQTRDYEIVSELYNVDNLNCNIYDENGKIKFYDSGSGQVNISFQAIAGKNYFIEIYNSSQSPCDYTITLS